MSTKIKTMIFLGDGMADEPLSELNGKTPLQAAATPGMDQIARLGRSGTLLTLPQPFPTSSDVANMSVLGCDLESEYCGRAVLEAAGQGLELKEDDLALRCNLISVSNDGRMEDFSGGHPDQEVAVEMIAALNAAFGSDTVRFYPGVSYRCLLILSGKQFSAEINCEKPDDHPGGVIADLLPRSLSPAAENTAALLRDLMARAPEVLAATEANRAARSRGATGINGIWPWSPGRPRPMLTLQERFGISSAVISAVDVIRGLGKRLGMSVLDVPGATGYIDTNYEGKAKAAIEAMRNHDLVYLHVEAIDEVSHARDLKLKLKAIEDFDSRIVQPVMRACGSQIRYVVLPDHPVPIRLGTHVRTPVPVAMCGPGLEQDKVESFDELASPCGALGALFGPELMTYLFGIPEPGVGG